jgi:hypothetical protein
MQHQRRLLYVPLTGAEFARLRELAWDERRSPRDHAALLLLKALGFEHSGGPATDHATSPKPPRASAGADAEEGVTA